ncbi:MAG: hypothetical protein K0S24_1916 [Sphingobacterium sp.]|jgi:transcription antitermination factor NusG|nr:hypothetical protein [Sphingobacterium sp.]
MTKPTNTNIWNQWIVMYTKSNCERKYSEFLNDNNIVHFLPLRRVLKKWHDRNKLLHQPLFPSYVFVKLKSRQEYMTSLSCKWCNYFLKTNNTISTIEEFIISDLKKILDSETKFDISNSKNLGRKVIIQGGILNGLIGDLLEVNNKKNIQISISAIHRSLLLSSESIKYTEINNLQLESIS